MSVWRQSWLVALREMRERSRSRAFQISMVVMVVVVLVAIIVPALLDKGPGTKHVGVTGSVPTGLAQVLQAQGKAAGGTIRVRTYGTLASGEDAVRAGKVDLLVVNGRRLEWRRQTDDQLKAVVVGALQLVEVQQRAATAGIDQAALQALLAPVQITNVELGSVAGRTPDDETAAFIMAVLLLIALSTYGNLVLSGVVEEKSSRVVEVLLARMPARALLAGKVAGIGLLGLAQFGVIALVALIATKSVDSVDIPAARGSVIAWAVVWFVLGYALYAMAYGALGSLASRPEDAQSAAGPVMAVMLVAYVSAFAAVGKPESGIAQLASFLPPTAPLAMPTRIAMGATAWWEPVAAAVLAVAAIAALVQFGGRVYAGAVLHAGPAVRLRDAWRGTSRRDADQA